MLTEVVPWLFSASHEYVPASCLVSFVIFKIGPSDIILSVPELELEAVAIGNPSFVQV